MLKESKIGIFKYIISTLLLFLYLYQFRMEVIGLPSQMHSTRIGAIGLCLLGLFSVKRDIKTVYTVVGVYKYLFLCLLLLLYSIILITFKGKGIGLHFSDAILNNLIFTIPVIWALSNIFHDIESFFSVLISVGVIQSVFIIICLIYEPFQIILDHTFNNVDSETHNVLILRSGYAGGLGCITSTGVIRYTTSLFATSYLYVKKEKSRYFFLFVLFAIMNSMIARTGLLMDLLFLFYILFSRNNGKKMATYLLSLCIVCGALYLIVNSGQYDSFIEERFHRYTNLEENGLKEDFFSGYFSGEIPAIQNNLLIGTGLQSGVATDGTVVHIDGGFLRTYSAVGLFFTLVIYAFFLRVMIKNMKSQKNKADKIFMFFILLFILIAEFKEMTLFIVWPLTIYFTIAVLLYKTSLNHDSVHRYYVNQ